jgi:hypothetical protein
MIVTPLPRQPVDALLEEMIETLIGLPADSVVVSLAKERVVIHDYCPAVSVKPDLLSLFLKIN